MGDSSQNLHWIHESVAHWDADKARIVGGARTGTLPSKLASHTAGDVLPDDWWLLPPSHEKDQSATADAHRQLTTFLKNYPKSAFRTKAAKRLAAINDRLASHEMYVARFYWERGKPMGTVLRLRRLLKQHRGTRHDAPAMYLLGRAYVAVDMRDRAKETWAEYVKTFPNHSQVSKARSALGKL